MITHININMIVIDVIYIYIGPMIIYILYNQYIDKYKNYLLCYLLGTRLCGFRHVTINESKFQGYMDSNYYSDWERSHQICFLDRAYCKAAKLCKVPS